ncbi:Alpha-tocopherol transfer protein-like [Halotydeus destructor]|nr:Alpha-tocopherol transfer protein-like [Halotydeus destructor]
MSTAELRDRLQEYGILKNKMADELLQAFLNVTNDDVEAACERIKRYTTARQRYPGLFGQVGTAKRLLASGLATFLPSKTPSGASVIYMSSKHWNPKQMTHEEYNAVIITILEHKAVECSKGVYVVMDMGAFGLKHMPTLTPRSTMDTVELFTEILPVNVISVINYDCGLTARAGWKLVAPFLKKEIAAKSVLLGRDTRKLHELVAPSTLPDLCGGLAGPFDSEPYLCELKADEDKLVRKWNDHQV